MSLINWNDQEFLLGVGVMDDTHHEFIDLVNELAMADDRTFKGLFDTLITHTLQHFEQEERLMLDSAFPAINEHKDEHQRILGELNQFKKRVDKGLLSFGRSYINDRMPGWFRLHAASMDSALAAHLKDLHFQT
jgi:hemerythrin-like metal-binding protein